jgi:rfaE bifunctional protein kinase chain/domain
MSLFPKEAIEHARVLVVGDIMLDRYWFGEVERISPEAPVPVVRVVKREDRLGGAANVARNIVALGAHATLAGFIGEDEAAASVRQLLSEAEIEAHMITDAAHPTTLKMRVLGMQQQLLRIDFEEKPTVALLDALREQVEHLLSAHDVLVLSDYAKGALTQVDLLIELARKKGLPILVDPKGTDYQRYRGASLVTPNRSEMQQAVGVWSTEQVLTERAQVLREQLELDALLVTRSEQGMTLFTGQGREHVDAQAHEVFDVSGAGDTVLATLAVMRAVDVDWPTAMQWANRAGGIVVGKLGTSIVTAGELS